MATKTKAAEKRDTSVVRKAPGTRLGTWEDWRGGSSKTGRVGTRFGHGIRDGRK